MTESKYPPEGTPEAAPRLTVIVPIYNERHTIHEILRRVLAAPIDLEVVAVDDGSTDGTREMLRELEGAYPNVRIVLKERNEGKGSAVRAAIPYARGEYIVIQDGDLEYDPQDFPRLVEAADRGADVVYGSRFLSGSPPMRLPNRIINWLLAAMVRVLYRAHITDEATCYKLFRREVLQSLPLTCMRFEFCPEVTAKVLRRGHRIVEVPIAYTPRTAAAGKKIRPRDGIEAIYTLLRYVFWRG